MPNPKNFAIIGVTGYIAPRHLQAIKDTGNNVTAAYDPHDSAGILDRYSYDIDFFTEFERFDRYAEKHKRHPESGKKIDFVSICSPNYLHDAHIRFGLRIGADVICEKPLVLNPWNVDPLLELEKESGKKVWNMLQLRVHPSIVSLKRNIDAGSHTRKYDIELVYITPRGKWYHSSWKGDTNKSGGVATNIGVHFFDMLIWVFGKVLDQKLYIKSDQKAAGEIELEKASVRWFLSIDKNDLPENKKDVKAFRSVTIDGNEMEFSEGFTDLHTIVYKSILEGKGYGLEEARPSIQLVHDIRKSEASGFMSDKVAEDFLHKFNLNKIQS